MCVEELVEVNFERNLSRSSPYPTGFTLTLVSMNYVTMGATMHVFGAGGFRRKDNRSGGVRSPNPLCSVGRVGNLTIVGAVVVVVTWLYP